MKTNFKVNDVEYEVFFAKDDQQVEIYEKNNPRNGLIFNNYKHLVIFINALTDIMEDKV